MSKSGWNKSGNTAWIRQLVFTVRFNALNKLRISVNDMIIYKTLSYRSWDTSSNNDFF